MEGVRQLCAGRQRGTAPGASVAGSGRQERCPSVAGLASQPSLRHCNRTSAWHAALVICPANSWNLIKAIFPTLLPCLYHSSCWTTTPMALFILAFWTVLLFLYESVIVVLYNWLRNSGVHFLVVFCNLILSSRRLFFFRLYTSFGGLFLGFFFFLNTEGYCALYHVLFIFHCPTNHPQIVINKFR